METVFDKLSPEVQALIDPSAIKEANSPFWTVTEFVAGLPVVTRAQINSKPDKFGRFWSDATARPFSKVAGQETGSLRVLGDPEAQNRVALVQASRDYSDDAGKVVVAKGTPDFMLVPAPAVAPVAGAPVAPVAPPVTPPVTA